MRRRQRTSGARRIDKRKHERAMFEGLLNTDPEFAGERVVEWHQPDDASDFPDVVCTSETGRKIGIEIGEWLNETEVRTARDKEDRENSILQAIGDQGQ